MLVRYCSITGSVDSRRKANWFTGSRYSAEPVNQLEKSAKNPLLLRAYQMRIWSRPQFPKASIRKVYTLRALPCGWRWADAPSNPSPCDANRQKKRNEKSRAPIRWESRPRCLSVRKEIAGNREWQYNAPAQLPFHHALGTAQADKEGSSHADCFHPASCYGLRPVLSV